jgi:hypothetical protein
MLDVTIVLFIIICGIFLCQHNFIIGINLSYYCGNMFQWNVAIFWPTKL